MAVKIPQYNEQVSARGPMRSINVPSIQGPSTNAFQIAAEGLKQGAGIARELESRDRQAEADQRRLSAEAKQQEERDAQMWVADRLPGFHIARETDFGDQFKKAGPGATGFSQSYSKTFNDEAAKLRETAPNDTTKRMLDLHLSKSFEHYGMKALGAERGETERFHGETRARGIVDSARAVFSSPDQFDLLFGTQSEAIKNNGAISESKRAELGEALRKDMANAAVEAHIARNPGQALRDMEAALPKNSSFSAKGPAGAYTVPFGLGTDEEKRHWMNRAEQEVGKIRQEAQVGLQSEIQNAQAMARDGVAPVNPPLARSSFLNAYEKPEVAERQWQQYITAYQTAGATARLATAPSADLIGLINSQPNPKDKDYAIKSANLNIQQAAATRILQQRQADPVAYAMQTKDFGFTPIDPSKPEFVGELQKRAASLPVMAAKYGKAEILTNSEGQMLAALIHTMDVNGQIGLLKDLHTGLSGSDGYRHVMQSIRPDSPVTAVVGHIIAAGESNIPVAKTILAGEKILNKTKGDKQTDGVGKFPMPKESELRGKWDEYVGAAYAGYPGASDVAYQSFRAYYAGKAAAKGINSATDGMNDDIVNEALAASTGGVAHWDTTVFTGPKERKIILPYGMGASKFRDAFAAEWNKNKADFGASKTNFNDMNLYNTGANGEYLLMSGSGWMAVSGGDGVVVKITPEGSGSRRISARAANKILGGGE